MTGHRILLRTWAAPVAALGLAAVLVPLLHPAGAPAVPAPAHSLALDLTATMVGATAVEAGEVRGHGVGEQRRPARPQASCDATAPAVHVAHVVRGRRVGATLPPSRRRAARTLSAVQACVPIVAFQSDVRIVSGRLRTALLVNIAEPAGRARVAGVRGCVVNARPGVPVWISCRYHGNSQKLTIIVTLRDGRVITHPVVLSHTCTQGSGGSRRRAVTTTGPLLAAPQRAPATC
jgi:hypothetical protein